VSDQELIRVRRIRDEAVQYASACIKGCTILYSIQ
jgi:hypothetical protein